MILPPKPLRLFPLLILAVTSQLGCVALNLPSERVHDPSDRGGVLGPWKWSPTGSVLGHGTAPSAEALDLSDTISQGDSRPNDTACLDGGPLEVDPFGEPLDAAGHPPKPEVPWPRFHPVPTRAVFGPSL